MKYIFVNSCLLGSFPNPYPKHGNFYTSYFNFNRELDVWRLECNFRLDLLK